MKLFLLNRNRERARGARPGGRDIAVLLLAASRGSRLGATRRRRSHAILTRP